MRILIAGAYGLLGSELMKQALTHGHEAIALEGDITQEEQVREQIRHAHPDAIINAAALSIVKMGEQEPERAHQVNGLGARYLAEGAKELSIPVIYISTVSVFSGEGNYREEDTPDLGNVYNKTKREGEVFTLEYEKGIVARINMLGIHQNGSRGRAFLEWMTDTIKSNKDLTLYTDSRINPLSNMTLAGMLLQLVEKPPAFSVIHLGSRDVVSKADIGEMVLSYFPEYTGTVTRTPQPIESTQPKEMWLNTERAIEIFGTLPSVAEEVTKIMSFQSPQ